MQNRRVVAALTYPNRHIVDVFERLSHSFGYELEYFFFNPIPEFRSLNNWVTPSNSTMLRLSRPKCYASFFREQRDCKALFFQGLLRPFPMNIVTQFFSRNNRFVLSEGSRNPGGQPWGVRMVLNLMFGTEKTQHLSIGTGSSRDYHAAGLKKWRYRKFGFCESYNSKEGPCWGHAPADSIVLLCVGRLIGRKNFSQLLKVLSKYEGERQITVAICGEGEEEKNLRLLASRLPKNVHVHFAGHCDKETLDSYYRRADVFVLPSTYEGWGVVVNQALHFGLPLLLRSTVRSGVDYLLVENKNGLSFTDDSSLLAAIEKLAADDDLRKRMSEYSEIHDEIWCLDSIVKRLDLLIQDPDVDFDGGPLSIVNV